MAKKKYIKRLAKEVGVEPSSLDNWTSEDIDNPVYSKTDYTSGAQKRRDEEYIKGLQRARNENFINTVVPAAELGMSLSPAGDIMDAASMVDAANKGNYGEAALYGLGVLPFVSGKVLKTVVEKANNLLDVPITYSKGFAMAVSDKRKYDRPFSESLGALFASKEKLNKINENAEKLSKEGFKYAEEYFENPNTIRKLLKVSVKGDDPIGFKRYESLIDDFDNDELVKDYRVKLRMDEFKNNLTSRIQNSKRGRGANGHYSYYPSNEIIVNSTIGPYVVRDNDVLLTGVHEGAHFYQDLFTNNNLGKELSEEFKKYGVTKKYWNDILELHASLLESKKELGLGPDDKITGNNAIQLLQSNNTRLMNHFDKNKILKDSRGWLNFINKLPIVLPALIGGAAVSNNITEDNETTEMAKGGKVMNKYIQQSFTSGAGQKFIQDLINAGLDMNSAIAIAANAWQESRLQPDATNPESGAYGLFQWLGPRKKALFKKYGKKGQDGKEYVSYEDQMKYFLEDELPSATAWLGKSKRDAFHDANKDVYEKTFLFLKDFERPGDFDEEGRRRARFAYEIGKTLSGDMTEFDEGKYPGYFTDTTRINVKPLEEEPQQQIPSAIERQGRIVEENIQANQNISPSKIANEIKSTNFATRSGNPEPIEVQDAATQLLADIEGEKMRTDFLQAVVDNIQLNPVRQTRDKKTKLFIGFGF